MKWSFILMAILFTCDAHAQESFDYRRFLPLEEGNEWEYASWRDGESIYRYTQLLVTGDTTINGDRFATVEQTIFDVSGVPVNKTTCALRVGNAPDYDVSHVETNGGCHVPQCFPYPFLARLSGLNRVAPGSFTVGWRNYEAARLAERGNGACHREFCDTVWIFYASDVGVYECWGGQEQYVPGTGVRTNYGRSHLIFARIGAKTYGAEWLRDDAKSLDEESHFGFEIHPNPFSNSLTLEFRRNDRPAGALHVELYDLLGRELLDMPALREVDRRLVLDNEVSGLPSGVYLLRVRSADGRGLTRKVSKAF